MRRLLPTLALVGCVAHVDVDLDEDEDGLLTSEEARLGTDPDEPDSDADGWNDGDEVAGNTDPTDAADKPYELGWRIDACRHDVEPTGNEVGEVAENIELVDQLDETVRLHDFCDQAVAVVNAGFT